MKLVKPSWEIWEQEPGTQGIYKAIERAGRVCYKSENKITEGSAKPFVDRMITSGHGAMLEHGTVYLHIKDYYNSEASKTIAHYTGTGTIISSNFSVKKMQSNPYSKCNIMGLGLHGRQAYITTNYRTIVENNWLDDLKYLCEPTKYHEKRVTVHFVCDRGVSHEFVRHRVMSFAQESTRYCNYSKDKFGNEVTFIEPCWLQEYNYNGNTYQNCFLTALAAAEASYFDLLKKWDDKIPDKRYKTGFRNNPWTPQQARAVLPNALKTELVMTGFVSDWEHFFELRTPANAHPQARELAIPLSEEFVKRELIK